jgi:hypothetical protein
VTTLPHAIADGHCARTSAGNGLSRLRIRDEEDACLEVIRDLRMHESGALHRVQHLQGAIPHVTDVPVVRWVSFETMNCVVEGNRMGADVAVAGHKGPFMRGMCHGMN